jgi:hypothetical protein
MLTKISKFLTIKRIKFILITYVVVILSIVFLTGFYDLQKTIAIFQKKTYYLPDYIDYFFTYIFSITIIAPFTEEFIYRFWLKNEQKFRMFKVYLIVVCIYISLASITRYFNTTLYNKIFNYFDWYVTDENGFRYPTFLSDYKNILNATIFLPFIFIFQNPLTKTYSIFIKKLRESKYWIIFNTFIVFLGVYSHYSIYQSLDNPKEFITGSIILGFGFASFAFYRLKFNLKTSILFHMMTNLCTAATLAVATITHNSLVSLFYILIWIIIVLILILKEFNKFET